MQKKIKAVLFDWDLTLARALGDTSAEARLTALFQYAGLNYTINEVSTAVHACSQTGIGGQGKLQTQRDIARYYQQLLRHLGAENDSWELVNYLYNAYSYLPPVLYDDTLPTLRFLQQTGVTIGIVSNHSALIRPTIEENVGHYVSGNRIIISQELGVYKPAPTIFRHASGRLQTLPEDTVFVGDNLHVDAIGAVEKGGFKRGLWLDRSDMEWTRPLPPHVHRITSLVEVMEYV